jgi:hypothetical protein
MGRWRAEARRFLLAEVRDRRDWRAIRLWAGSIATSLGAPAT